MAQGRTNSADITRVVDAQITKLVEQVRDTHTQIETLAEQVKKTKEELRVLLELRGSNWSDDIGYARLTSEGVRVSYDRDSLDELIIKNPIQYGWLKDYRRETNVQGTVQVK